MSKHEAFHTSASKTGRSLGRKPVTSWFIVEFLCHSKQMLSEHSVCQPPGRGPVPGPGFYYTGPREVLLEFVILVF